MILIAVDGQGCHHLTIEVSKRRYYRPEYMEALYNSIEMVFKKLKYHKGKNIITITEVDDEPSTEKKTEAEYPTVEITHKPWHFSI